MKKSVSRSIGHRKTARLVETVTQTHPNVVEMISSATNRAFNARLPNRIQTIYILNADRGPKSSRVNDRKYSRTDHATDEEGDTNQMDAKHLLATTAVRMKKRNRNQTNKTIMLLDVQLRNRITTYASMGRAFIRIIAVHNRFK
jgi:hypothetical protein